MMCQAPRPRASPRVTRVYDGAYLKVVDDYYKIEDAYRYARSGELGNYTYTQADDGEYLKDIFKQIQRKQLNESGNWYIFGRGDPWIGPGETWQEAEDRIVREYCEATGHWDLFIWKEVKE